MTNSPTPSSPNTELVQFPAALQSGQARAVSAQATQQFQEGIAHLQSGDAAEAVEAFSHCIQYAPEFPDAHVFLGIAHSLTYNIYPAIDHLREAVKLDPDSFAAHYIFAQLNFKLRIPKKGYEEARHALRCVQTLEQRRMLTQLLKEERERERNGIARPAFGKPFGNPMLFLTGCAIAAALIFVIAHLH